MEVLHFGSRMTGDKTWAQGSSGPGACPLMGSGLWTVALNFRLTHLIAF